ITMKHPRNSSMLTCPRARGHVSMLEFRGCFIVMRPRATRAGAAPRSAAARPLNRWSPNKEGDVMSHSNRLIGGRRAASAAAAIALFAAAWCGGGCAQRGNDVVARQGSYELRDRDIKQSVLTTNLDAGDRARIDYMGHQP